MSHEKSMHARSTQKENFQNFISIFMTFFCFLSYKYKYGTRKNLLPFVLKMLNSATTFSMKSGFFAGYKGGYKGTGPV